MADRYTYLPQIGLCIAVAWGAAYVLFTLRVRPAPQNAASNARDARTRGVAVVSAAIVVALMGCAWRQTTFWRDSRTLWEHALACTSDNSTAHTNLGAALVEQGDTNAAIKHYETALSIQPNNPDAHSNLGALLAAAGRIDEAIEHYQTALEINPGASETHYNLGVAMARRGRIDDAIAHYRTALELSPDCVEAHANLGSALESQGNTAEAVKHFKIGADLAQRQNKGALAEALKARLRRYESQLPPDQPP